MALFWRLLLAHLLADYPLQPHALVALKSKPGGLAIHLGVHLAMMLILVWPVLALVWPALLILTLIHGWLDRTKIRSTARLRLSEPAAYLLDQALHLASLILVAWAFTRTSQKVQTLPLAVWSIQGVILILCTHFWAITERVLSVRQPGYQEEVAAQLWPRMIARGLPIVVVLATNGGYASAGAALSLPYAGTYYWRRALLTDIVVSALGVIALLLLT